MPVSKANQRAVTKYMKANYDEVKIRVPKGRKQVSKNCADAGGQSINSYIFQAVNERIEREKGVSNNEGN